MTGRKPIIALDCDGVLLDYNLALAKHWGRFTGIEPAEIDPLAYWYLDRWNIQRLTGERLAQWRDFLDDEFWSTIPAFPGAVQACQSLHESGFELVCVTALSDRFAEARQKNLRDHGLPITQLYTTGRGLGQNSPKKAILDALSPIAFVDDYLPYFEGVDSQIHTALILREPNGSPNTGPGLNAISSTYSTLAEFTQRWLTRQT